MPVLYLRESKMDKKFEYKGYLITISKVATMFHVWAYKLGSTELEYIMAYPRAIDAEKRGKYLIDYKLRSQ